MKFVDHVHITLKAGDGGPGKSSFRREKFVPLGGPDGGNGGKGGDVVFIATTQLNTLMDLTLRKNYMAQNGEAGKGKKLFGKDGADCIIKVPCGTQIFDENDELICDLTEPNQTFIAAHGGKGGQGNALFATSVNRAPTYAQPGLPGDMRAFRIELKLLAQVGLCGLPNAGKSTLLKALTNANPKIANYPFTTLHPNLGVLKLSDKEIVIADIPGVIEGASKGVGLGLDFLRHIDRTHLLVHVVAAEPESDLILKNIKIVENELKTSELDLTQKKRIVVLNKIDILSETELKTTLKALKAKKYTVIPISAVTRQGLSDLIQAITAEH
ncbi:MAG: GTPase ObgE [Candidatus Margulisiibacteriota bacterium]